MALNFSFLNSFFSSCSASTLAERLSSFFVTFRMRNRETGRGHFFTFLAFQCHKLRLPTEKRLKTRVNLPKKRKNIRVFAPELENPETLYLEGKSFKKY